MFQGAAYPPGTVRWNLAEVLRLLGARLQRLADATFWPRFGGGCHVSRYTGAAIEDAGFTVEEMKRFFFTPGARVPPLPHILGVARRN